VSVLPGDYLQRLIDRLRERDDNARSQWPHGCRSSNSGSSSFATSSGEALALARRGVDLDPSSAACQVGLDQVLLMIGMLDEAKALTARIVRNERSPRERDVGEALLLSAASAAPSSEIARSPQ